MCIDVRDLTNDFCIGVFSGCTDNWFCTVRMAALISSHTKKYFDCRCGIISRWFRRRIIQWRIFGRFKVHKLSYHGRLRGSMSLLSQNRYLHSDASICITSRYNAVGSQVFLCSIPPEAMRTFLRPEQPFSSRPRADQVKPRSLRARVKPARA